MVRVTEPNFVQQQSSSDVLGEQALNTPLKMGKLRPEKGKVLFKAPSELVAGSRLEPRSLIPSLGLAQALPLSECSFLVS